MRVKMTDRIKSAREAVNAGLRWYNGTEKVGYIDLISFEQLQTILKALSAYERLQGVPLKAMKRTERNPVEQGGKTNDWYQNGYDVGYNQAIDDVKARLVADIGGK